MVGPRFLYGYSSSGATMSATVTGAGYDAANAVALDRGTTWKGSGTSAQRLIMHTGSAISPSGLGISAGNYSVWGTTVLQHSTDGVTWTTYATLTVSGLTDSVQDYFDTLTPISKSWWCLYWAAPSAAPEVGIFYLGTLTTIADNYVHPFDESDVYGVDVQTSEGRVIVAEQVARRRNRFLLDFGNTTTAVRDSVRTIIQSEGGPLRPFYFVPIDESGSSTEGRAYFVRYEPAAFGMRRIFTNVHEFSLPLLEEV